MQRSLPALIALVLLFSTVGWSADFEKGYEAYKRKDYETALREWRPLAEQGQALVQYNLGVMYYEGRGVPQDYTTAAKWYTLAAEQGYAMAQHNLGVMYSNGEGVPQDYTAAVKWYTRAAEQGDADAQYNLGVMYRDGEGVPQSYVYAHMWFNIAASQGRKDVAELNALAAKEMSPSQIEKAQELTSECVKKKFKGCD